MNLVFLHLRLLRAVQVSLICFITYKIAFQTPERRFDCTDRTHFLL